MNKDYIINETRDIFESLETIESLQFVYELLDLILQEIGFNLDTEKDKKDYNTLTTCLLSIKEILKEQGAI